MNQGWEPKREGGFPWLTPGQGWWLLVLATATVYAGTFRGELVYDAAVIVGADPRLGAFTWGNVRLIFTENYWYPTLETSLYRPLTTLSFLVERAGWGAGAEPGPYRAMNLGIHLLNGVLLAGVLRLWRGGRWGWAETGACGLFWLHPVMTEAVTNLVGRSDLLALTGVLGALWVHGGGRGGWWRWVGVAGFALVAVGGKESGVVVIPLVGLQHLWWRRTEDGSQRTEDGRRRWGWVGMGLALSPAALVFLWARVHFGVEGGEAGAHVFIDNPLAAQATGWRVLGALAVLADYARLVVAPFSGQSADYSWAARTGFEFGRVGAWAGALVGVGLVVAGGWGIARTWRTRPAVAFGLGWAGLAWLPTSNLLVAIGSIQAERFLYLPMAGLAVGLAAGARWAASQGWKVELGRGVLVVGLAGCAVMTMGRSQVWLNEFTLWQSVQARQPDSYRGLVGLARQEFLGARTAEDLARAVGLAERGVAWLRDERVPVQSVDVTAFFEWGEYGLALANKRLAGGARAEAEAGWRVAIAAVDEGREAGRRMAEAGGVGARRLDGARLPPVLDFAVKSEALRALGEGEAALAEAERGLNFNPLNGRLNLAAARAGLAVGRAEEALGYGLTAVLFDSGNVEVLRFMSAELGREAWVVRLGERAFIDLQQAELGAALERVLPGLADRLEAAGLGEQAGQVRALREGGGE